MSQCLNCSFENQNNYKFCPDCGQPFGEDLTMKILFRETVGNYFSFDSSLRRSILPVLFKPGLIAKEFVRGKRTLYIHPAKFYLFASFVFFIVMGIVSKFEENSSYSIENSESIKDPSALVGNASVDSINSNENTNYENNISVSNNGLETTYSSTQDNFFFSKFSEGMDKQRGDSSFNFVSAFLSNLPIALILSVPVFALILLILLYKQPYKYAGHLVFSLYYFTFTFFVWTFFFAFRDVFPSDFESILLIALILVMWAYLVKGIKRFYELTWIKSLAISIVQGGLYLGVIMPIIAVILVFTAIAFG